MFKVRGTYRHKNCLGIDIYVHKIIDIEPDSWIVRVSYIDERSKGYYGTETVKIVKSQFNNWVFIPGPLTVQFT